MGQCWGYTALLQLPLKLPSTDASGLARAAPQVLLQHHLQGLRQLCPAALPTLSLSGPQHLTPDTQFLH